MTLTCTLSHEIGKADKFLFHFRNSRLTLRMVKWFSRACETSVSSVPSVFAVGSSSTPWQRTQAPWCVMGCREEPWLKGLCSSHKCSWVPSKLSRPAGCVDHIQPGDCFSTRPGDSPLERFLVLPWPFPLLLPLAFSSTSRTPAL